MAGWLERCIARPAVARGLQVGREYAKQLDLGRNKEAQAILFGQKAR
jgi:GST-like protein